MKWFEMAAYDAAKVFYTRVHNIIYISLETLLTWFYLIIRWAFPMGFNIFPQTWHRVVSQAIEPSLKMQMELILK